MTALGNEEYPPSKVSDKLRQWAYDLVTLHPSLDELSYKSLEDLVDRRFYGLQLIVLDAIRASKQEGRDEREREMLTEFLAEKQRLVQMLDKSDEALQRLATKEEELKAEMAELQGQLDYDAMRE